MCPAVSLCGCVSLSLFLSVALWLRVSLALCVSLCHRVDRVEEVEEVVVPAPPQHLCVCVSLCVCVCARDSVSVWDGCEMSGETQRSVERSRHWSGRMLPFQTLLPFGTTFVK